MRWEIEFGGLAEQDRLEAHLSTRGISIDDIVSAAANAIPRRKGSRIYLFGRAQSGEPIVVVLTPAGKQWHPGTAWVMDSRERRWWLSHGGR